MVRSSGFTADVYNTQGKVVSKVALPKEVFGAKVNDSLMSQAVRVYLANQRMGTASTKNRGEITGSTKKSGDRREQDEQGTVPGRLRFLLEEELLLDRGQEIIP